MKVIHLKLSDQFISALCNGIFQLKSGKTRRKKVFFIRCFSGREK